MHRFKKTAKLLGAAGALLLIASACSNSSDDSEPTLATAVPSVFSGTSEPNTTATTAPVARTSTTLPQQNSTEESNGPLTLGYLLASTGELASFSAPLIISIQMAVADAQAAGFQDVVLVGADTASSAEAISSEFDGLLVQGADGIVGASSSALTTIIVPKAKESQTVLISPSATSVTLTEAEDDGYFFRTPPSDLYWGKVLADRVATYGGERAVIVYRDDIFGSSLATEASDDLEADGVTVVDWIRLDPDPSITSFSDEVAQLLEAGADSFVLISFEREGALFFRQYLEAAEAAEAPKMNAYISEDFVDPPWEPLPEDGVGALPGISNIRGSGPSVESEKRSDFEERYREYVSSPEFSCPESMSEEACLATREHIASAPAAYDAAVIVMLASLQTDSTDPTVFAPAINDITREGRPCSSYEECAQLILDGINIDYDGISGPLDFTDAGEPDRGTYQLWMLNDIGQMQSEGQLTIG